MFAYKIEQIRVNLTHFWVALAGVNSFKQAIKTNAYQIKSDQDTYIPRPSQPDQVQKAVCSKFSFCCNICITFVQCWTNGEDVGPTLYKCYTSVFLA